MRTKRTSGNKHVEAANTRSITIRASTTTSRDLQTGKITRVEKDAGKLGVRGHGSSPSRRLIEQHVWPFGPGRSKEAAKRRFRIWKRAEGVHQRRG